MTTWKGWITISAVQRAREPEVLAWGDAPLPHAARQVRVARSYCASPTEAKLGNARRLGGVTQPKHAGYQPVMNASTSHVLRWRDASHVQRWRVVSTPAAVRRA